MLYISLLMIAVLIGASLIFSGYDRKRLKYTYKMKGFNNFFYPFACWLYRHFVKGHTQKRLDLIRQLYPAADPEKIHYDAKNGSVYEKRNSGMCAGGYASGTDRMQSAYEAGTGSRYRECKQ